MINLSPIIYRKIQISGPIERLEITRISNYYHASAFLKKELRFTFEHNYFLYDNAVDGNGLDDSPTIAINKAISEAIERWAFYYLFSKNKHSLAPTFSTLGMAAYPEPFHFWSKRYSEKEAAERWALLTWNKIRNKNSKIIKLGDLQYIQLSCPIQKYYIVIVWQPYLNFYAYGFAAGTTLNKALYSAKMELYRNCNVLKRKERKSSNIYEQRLIYYSTSGGHQRFLDIVEKNTYSKLAKPATLAHNAVTGPWSKYAKVWRTVFGPNELYEDDYVSAKDFFLF